MTKRIEPPKLSAAQLQIMDIVWHRGEATVAEVWETLSSKRPLARNTIQTMMMRLEKKGLLKHTTEGVAFRYTAVYPREATLQRLVRNLVETAFSGSAEGLVMALLEDPGVSRDEADRIRAMINKVQEDRT